MNKNICLVLAIIFIVLVVMGSSAYSWSWIECGGGMKEISDINDQAVTAENFRDLVKEQGMDFIPLRGDIKKMLSGPEGRKFFKSKNPITLVRSMKRASTELVQTMQDDILKALEGADASVFSYLCGPV